MGDYVENPASQVTRTLPCGAVGGPRPEKNLVAGGYKGQNKGAKYGLRPRNCGYGLLRDVVAGRRKETKSEPSV